MSRQKYTNKFTGGLSTDFGKSEQPPNTVTYSLNGGIFYNTGGSLEWQSTPGFQNVLTFAADYGTSPTGYQPLGSIAFSDKLAVLSTNGTNSEIGLIFVAQNGAVSYQTIYNDRYDPFGGKLNFSFAHDILSIIANKENKSIQRIYWTDDFNIDRVFNVVEGLTVNSPAFVDGDYNPLISTGLYPPFYSAFSMDSVPDVSPGIVQFVQTIDGELLSGMYQYCYRLVTKDGYKTPFSTPILPLFLTTDPVNGVDSSQYGMQASSLPTSKGIQIQVNGIDTRYDQIEVCYIYSIVASASASAAVFATVNIDGQTSITVNNISNGGAPIDLTLISVELTSVKTVKALAVRENYMFKGNITSRVPPDYDASPITVEPYIRSVQADEQAISTQNVPFLAVSAYNNSTKIQNYIDNTSTSRFTTHQIRSDYISYSGMQVSHLFGGYFRGEWARLGILLYDKKGLPMFVYHVCDIQMPEQYLNTYQTIKIDANGNIVTSDFTKGSIGDYCLTDNNGASHRDPFVETTGEPSDVRTRIMGLMLSNIDLTDFIDDISGFSIVRVKRDPTILGQGILLNMVNEAAGTDMDKIRAMGYPSNNFNGSQQWMDAQGNLIYGKTVTLLLDTNYLIRPFTFTFECPDNLFDPATIPTLQKNHSLKSVGGCHMTEVAGSIGSGNGYGYQDFGTDTAANNGRAGISDKSYYTDVTGFNDSFGNPVNFGRVSGIDFWVNFGFDSSQIGFDPTNLSLVLEGFCHIQNDGKLFFPIEPLIPNKLYNSGYHNDAMCIKSKDWFEMSMTRGTTTSRQAVCYQIVNYIINDKTPYNGVSEDSLAESIYISTGHFQPINESVKAQVLTGGRYIFNGVEVWGGDCYVDMFALARTYPQNNSADYDAGIHSMGIGNVFPCEMKFNALLRKGNYWAKSGFFAIAPYFPNGVSKDNPEIELINSALTYSETNALYTGFPLNFSFQGDFSARWIYSKVKTDGELVDSWRLYPVDQLADIDGRFGSITGAVTLFNEIYSFQELAFGRLRVLDRVPLQDPATGGLKIGVGGVLDNIEYKNTKFGTQNALSIITTFKEVYFVDVRNRAICRFGQNGFEQLDLVHGIHYDMRQLLGDPSNDFTADNPTLNGGIHGVYDMFKKEILYTFINRPDLSNAPLTLGYSEPGEQFSSYYSFRPRKYLPFGDNTYSFNAMIGLSFDYSVYDHNPISAGITCKFYGVVYNSELQFVVPPFSDNTKVFSNLNINSNDLTLGGGLLKLITIGYVTDQGTDSGTPPTDSRFRLKEGSYWVPIRGVSSPKPLRGQYLIVTFTFQNNGTSSVVTIKSVETTWRASHLWL